MLYLASRLIPFRVLTARESARHYPWTTFPLQIERAPFWRGSGNAWHPEDHWPRVVSSCLPRAHSPRIIFPSRRFPVDFPDPGAQVCDHVPGLSMVLVPSEEKFPGTMGAGLILFFLGSFCIKGIYCPTLCFSLSVLHMPLPH